MKYMTFNSSCSFAGIANMLDKCGIDTNDKDIALAMKLPYLFHFADDVYMSGSMLQTAEWFDLYLNPIGYSLTEETVAKDHLVDYLLNKNVAMLGIYVDEDEKHAVIYIENNSNSITFLNNKWENDSSPELIKLTPAELLKSVDNEVVVATLKKIQPTTVDFSTKLTTSLEVARANLNEILNVSKCKTTVGELRTKLNTLFRPFFLESISMMKLIGENELCDDFSSLQREFLTAIRQDANTILFLKDYISIEKLIISVEKYINLIENELKKCSNLLNFSSYLQLCPTRQSFL